MDRPIKWKNGARCAVMISFDVDGESPWILRDPALAERPLHMGTGAYGPKTGMPRILRILDRHHGYLHEKPFFLSGREEEEALLVKTLDIFQNVLGIRPQGSRAPSCDPSKHTMELLRKHGFVYHSNLMDADLPYCHKTPYGELVELPTAWVNDDWVYFGFSAVPPVGNGIWSQEDVFEIWKEEFEGAYEEGGFFNVMGHPQVIGRPSRMRMVERLIQHILAKKDVWLARPIEIAEHYLSQR